MAKYQLSEDEEKSLRKQFKKPDTDPKLFVVTDKLLTGFDAPVLYCMYLDKPMRDHVLLQSIARVNRPYSLEGNEKPYGLVVDFIGILNNLKKALAFDSKDVSGVIENIEVLFDNFEEKMKEARDYLKITDGTGGDKAVEKVIEHFSDKKERDKFIEFFRETQSLYEILSPDEKIRKHLDGYKTLGEMYALVIKNFETEELPLQYMEFQAKTERLIRQKVGAYQTKEKEVETAVSKETFERILKSGKNDKIKVHNLLKAIEKLLSEFKYGIVPASMAEKARRIKEDYEKNIAGARETVEQLNKTATEMLDMKRKFKESGKSARQFMSELILKRAGDAKAEENSAELEKLFDQFPNHFENPHQKRNLRFALYTTIGAVEKEARTALIEDLIKLDEHIKKEIQG